MLYLNFKKITIFNIKTLNVFINVNTNYNKKNQKTNIESLYYLNIKYYKIFMKTMLIMFLNIEIN